MNDDNNQNQTKTQLKYEDLYLGLKVIDGDGDIGVITEIEDKYNIHVGFGNTGVGIFCFNDCCVGTYKLYKHE